MSKSDIGLLALRVGAGSILAAHGLPKLFGGTDRQPPQVLSTLLGSNYAPAWQKSGTTNFANALRSMGVPRPEVAATASGLAEVGGGIALLLGAATPVAAAVVAANMTVAVSKAHWQTGFYGTGGFEFAMLLGAAALAIGLTGPGRISVDHLFG
ncbi:MAG: DoxX family protein [Candidatus Dormibacteria bacterium]